MKKIYLLITTVALMLFSVGELFSQTITVTGALNAFEKCSGSVSTSQNFAVEGANLDDDIEIDITPAELNLDENLVNSIAITPMKIQVSVSWKEGKRQRKLVLTTIKLMKKPR